MKKWLFPEGSSVKGSSEELVCEEVPSFTCFTRLRSSQNPANTL